MVSRLKFYSFWLRCVTYTLPGWALWIAFLLRFRTSLFGEREYDATHYAYFLLFSTALWAWFADKNKVSTVENLLWERTGIKAVSSACAGTFLVQSIALFFVRAVGFSRLFLGFHILALFILALLTRFIFRRVVGYHHKELKPLRVVVLGADGFADHVSKRLASTRLTNCRVMAHVQLPGQEVKVKGVPVCKLDEVDGLELSEVDDIIVAVPLSRFADISETLVTLQRLCKPIRAVMDFGRGVALREKLFQFGNLQMMDIVTSPAETTQYIFLKRIFDVVFSAMVLMATSPLLAIIAVAVKLSSPGPVLFRQERVGLNGQVFMMHKFRTMRVAAGAESDTRWTTENDPRRTWVGTFLRKTSLDELPQFLDVLKGDMSVVGPRPERPHFVRKFLADIQAYNERHRLKVGITGWAQVNGWRGDTSIDKRVECDLYYLQNWSFAFDLQIIIRTVWSGLVNKNAY